MASQRLGALFFCSVVAIFAGASSPAAAQMAPEQVTVTSWLRLRADHEHGVRGARGLATVITAPAFGALGYWIVKLADPAASLLQLGTLGRDTSALGASIETVGWLLVITAPIMLAGGIYLLAAPTPFERLWERWRQRLELGTLDAVTRARLVEDAQQIADDARSQRLTEGWIDVGMGGAGLVTLAAFAAAAPFASSTQNRAWEVFGFELALSGALTAIQAFLSTSPTEAGAAELEQLLDDGVRVAPTAWAAPGTAGVGASGRF